jgi:hypothetical protein
MGLSGFLMLLKQVTASCHLSRTNLQNVLQKNILHSFNLKMSTYQLIIGSYKP